MRNLFQAIVIAACLLFSNQNAQAQTSGYSGTGANIDVVYHRAEWEINPDISKYIKGKVTTYFVTKASNVNRITFDLSDAHTFSAQYHNTNLSVRRPSSNVIELTLPVTLPINRFDSVTIIYEGVPPTFGTYGEGYERGNFGTTTGNVIYTLSESYGDDDWWPCKADMQDRIDSMDFIITTPSAFKTATNGVLISDVVSGSNRIMTYKHRYPITTYLVAVSVARYNVFPRGTVNISGTNVPIVYYIYTGRGSNPTTQLTAMDFCKQEMIEFSRLFGDYPFKKEGYGMYEFGWGGGMEHQTFSAMSWSTMSSWSVIAHELAHQWFGNKVTFSTWNHLWLAEGFAKYLEALAAEVVPSLGQSAKTHRQSIKSTALATSTTPIYLSATSIANSNNMWSSSNNNAVYQRGAMVVSMLRKLAGDDKFYEACRNYLNDPVLSYKSATTEDLKNHFEAVLNYDLDGFFQDYIYGIGNPAYDINWGSNGNNINIELTTQRRSSTTSTYFRTPVVLRISNSTKDTTVVIYDENGKVSYAGSGIRQSHTGKVLGYKLSFTPTTVTVDPDHETMLRGQDNVTATTNRVGQSTVTRVTRLNTAPVYLLPINIVDFKGSNSSEGNYLALQLTSTDENISVQLERSRDGIDFSIVGNMSRNSFGGNEWSYHYWDKDILNAKFYYYRVKTTDERGVVKYSKVVKVSSLGKVDGVILSPNPASSVLQVALPVSFQNLPLTYTIYNSSGILLEKKRIKRAGNNIQVHVQQWPSGSYNINLISSGGLQIQKNFAVIH